MGRATKMPEISQFFNIHITFNYRNEHNPPHFHAIYQDEEISVDMENWELAQAHRPLKKITPLDKE